MKSNTQRILLAVDLSYQVYRAAAAHPTLTSGRHFTGGLYGFFMTLAKMIRETEATDLVICRDTKPYLRSLTYPQYKQLRKKNADDELLKMFNASVPMVLDVLQALGVPIWAIPGFESDDLIAHAATKYRHRYAYIYAASNDSDLFQLLWIHNFIVFKDSIGGVITGKTLMRKHGLTPAQFMLATALQGTHNDIEGIDRVGEVTARKAVLDPLLMRSFREKHADIIDRNLGLIKLPHDKFPHAETIPQLTRDRFDRRELYRLLGRYDIEVTASMVAAFERMYGQR